MSINKFAPEYEVLIVDDVATNALLAKNFLKKAGYRILVCDNGAEALRLAAERHPNLILLDIMMPVMDGFEVLRRLKGRPETTDIPVIIMSALDDTQSIARGYQLGAVEYVTKPFRCEELASRVEYRFELYAIKRARVELETAIERKDALHALVNHDLRLPAITIKMLCDTLTGQVDPERIGEEASGTVRQIRQMADELLSKLDALRAKVAENDSEAD